MKIVLDTNVLIAAFISHGTCAELLEHCVREHELITSEFILQEFHKNLTGKFGIPESDVAEAIDLIRSRFVFVNPDKLDQKTCRDADDDWILGSAMAGNCECLVTGDKDLLDLQKFRQIDIVSPSEFWKYEVRTKK